MKKFIAIKFSVSFVLLSSLYGCTALSNSMDTDFKYDETVIIGEKARLRVIYDYNSRVYIYPNRTCQDQKIGLGAGIAASKLIFKNNSFFESLGRITYTKKTLDMPYPPFELKPNLTKVYSEFYIPANKKFLVGMNYSVEGYYQRIRCSTGFYKMIAKPNGLYEAEVKVDSDRCHYIMNEITEDGQRVPLPLSSWKRSFDCK